MLATTYLALFAAGLVYAAPVLKRAEIDEAAAAEANPRDETATRAFTATPITTSDGQCLTVDRTAGDFRENLIPITTAACDGSEGQQWDIITAGKHNDQEGVANVVSTLTNGCLNFDPRRAAGNQVLLFSCGGRADGEGLVTDSQLFTFDGGAGPLPLVPKNGNDAVCLTAADGKIDQKACEAAQPDDTELFTIGEGGAAAGGAADNAAAGGVADGAAAEGADVAASSSSSADFTIATAPNPADSASSKAAAPTPAAPAAGADTPTPAGAAAAATGTAVLDEAAVAEAHQRDETATRAFSDSTIKTADGKCLKVDAQSGDFRENLIPITVEECDGSAGQKWDVITAGEHNDQEGTMLVVSTLTQGCMNLDLRRAAGNQVLLFSCGGRADGEGLVTDSQLFKFAGDANTALESSAKGDSAGKCLVDNAGKLDVTECSGDAAQTITFEA